MCNIFVMNKTISNDFIHMKKLDRHLYSLVLTFSKRQLTSPRRKRTSDL